MRAVRTRRGSRPAGRHSGVPQASFGGEDLYPTIIDKAAALFHSLIFNHPFLDGNKRIGVLVMLTFLKMNNHPILYTISIEYI